MIVCERTGEAVNPLDKELLPDELGLTIINYLAESIDYQRVNDKNRLTLMMKRVEISFGCNLGQNRGILLQHN